jgi:SAM-dependent methyltransferase
VAPLTSDQMSVCQTASPAISELSWEKIMSHTRYGRYADGVESSMVNYVLDHCPTPGTLLDVGCEGGRRSTPFADRGWQVIAMDPDPRALAVCQARIPGARCVLPSSDSRQLPADNASVDAILCIEVGQVIHAAWAAQEFARVLKPGGRLVAVCWNRTSWRGFLYHHASFLRAAGSLSIVGFPIKFKSFRQEMNRHGFQFERELGFAWGPFRRMSDSSWVDLWVPFERFSGLQQLVSVAPMVAFVAQKL